MATRRGGATTTRTPPQTPTYVPPQTPTYVPPQTPTYVPTGAVTQGGNRANQKLTAMKFMVSNYN